MDKEKTRILNNKVAMPTVGFGTYLIKDGEHTVTAVRSALEAGYRHIDTAAVYENETGVGEAVRQAGVPREELFITTKLWNDDIRKGKVLDAFSQSLKRLGLDYIDLYLIHWPADGYADAWLTMENLYREGVAKAIGISNFQPHHISTLMQRASIVPTVNQIECHPYLVQEELREYCRRLGILCESWSPLGGKGGNLLQDAALAKVAAQHKKTPAQIVLRWIVQLGLSVNPKSEHKERIRENIEVFDFALFDAEMATISGLNKNKRFGPDPDTFTF